MQSQVYDICRVVDDQNARSRSLDCGVVQISASPFVEMRSSRGQLSTRLIYT